MSDTSNQLTPCDLWWKHHEVNSHYLGNGEPQVLEIMTKLPSFKEELIICEYGCGAGRNLTLLNEYWDLYLYGYDFNPEMIKAAKRRLHIPLSTNRESIAEYGIFDLIFTLSVLDHILDPIEHIKWIAEHCHYMAFIEPWVGKECDMTPEFCDEPFSWSWNYDKLLKDYNVIDKYHSPIATGGLAEYYYTWIVKC